MLSILPIKVYVVRFQVLRVKNSSCALFIIMYFISLTINTTNCYNQNFQVFSERITKTQRCTKTWTIPTLKNPIEEVSIVVTDVPLNAWNTVPTDLNRGTFNVYGGIGTAIRTDPAHGLASYSPRQRDHYHHFPNTRAIVNECFNNRGSCPYIPNKGTAISLGLGICMSSLDLSTGAVISSHFTIRCQRRYRKLAA
jgi:hypothetical protein